jgi:cysteinyl-tRNA synthetase
MRLFNTLSRREEEFVPLRGNTVRMYTCGLTVYARGHIGNFRTFVACDVLRRALVNEAGFGMHQVMNFTDVDDRTIVESQKAGIPLREYTTRYIDAFRQDAAALGLEQPEHTPRATDDENIAAMGQTIAALEANGHTYRSDGSIYFRISTLPDYGKLARLDHAGIKSARASTATSTTSRTRATSSCGRRPGPASRRGIPGSARAGPAGTSSVPRWRCGCWASRRSIFTPAAST